MFKKSCLAIITLSSFSAFAAEELELPGERWLAEANGYICSSENSAAIAQPQALAAYDVVFESVTTDYSLDNGLLKATFTEESSVCRYSALLFADNAERTVELVESKVAAIEGKSLCEGGKALLDELLTFNDYLYWGRPKHLTIMVPDIDSEVVCGEGATHIGVDFTVSGRI
ncbi:MAG: hypothetical protein ACOH5I_17765 [Oligoflexus sp.]